MLARIAARIGPLADLYQRKPFDRTGWILYVINMFLLAFDVHDFNSEDTYFGFLYR